MKFILNRKLEKNEIEKYKKLIDDNDGIYETYKTFEEHGYLVGGKGFEGFVVLGDDKTILNITKKPLIISWGIIEKYVKIQINKLENEKNTQTKN